MNKIGEIMFTCFNDIETIDMDKLIGSLIVFLTEEEITNNIVGIVTEFRKNSKIILENDNVNGK